MENRLCTKCNTSKPVNEFVKSNVKRKLCKKCFYKLYIYKTPLNELILNDGEIFANINENYIATNYGRIISKPIISIRKNGWEQKRGYYELKQVVNSNGYMTVRINKITKTVHRLVLMAFNPQYDNLQVNHIDGNKKNNYLSNLEWLSNKENINHAVTIGLIKTIKVDCFNKNNIFIKRYDSIKDACLELNIANTNIYSMINNKKYPKTIKGYIFKKAIDINTLTQQK